jgi:hypothetical protein
MTQIQKITTKDDGYTIWVKVTHNFDFLKKGGVSLPLEILEPLSKLISFFPFTAAEEKAYQRLNKNGKTGFLCRYLMKLAQKVGGGTSGIRTLSKNPKKVSCL